jgi:hypothetical protein
VLPGTGFVPWLGAPGLRPGDVGEAPRVGELGLPAPLPGVAEGPWPELPLGVPVPPAPSSGVVFAPVPPLGDVFTTDPELRGLVGLCWPGATPPPPLGPDVGV